MTSYASVPHIAVDGAPGDRDRERDEFELSPLSSPTMSPRRSSSKNQPAGAKIPRSSPEITRSRPTRPPGLGTLFFSWIWTVIFTVVLVIVVKYYEHKGVLTDKQKDTFNTLSTGLILFLGLSFYEAFKGLAKALRPHLQRWFNPSPKASTLIEEFDGLLKVTQLLLSNVGIGLRLFALLWIFFNILAQVAAAIISLTYSVDDGKDYNGTYVRSGPVLVSNLICYMHSGACSLPVTVDALAHAYGDSTLGPDATEADETNSCGYFANTTSMIESQRNFRYYCRRNSSAAFGYRFNEYNVNDAQKTYPNFTNRTITAYSGVCNEYQQTGAQNNATVGDPHTENFISAVNFTYTNNATNGSILIPTSALGLEGTTYIYRGVQVPANTTVVPFGPRGLYMWAYRNPGKNQAPLFYECPVTVDPVTNVVNPQHNISDDLAREAVASIALQGQFKGAFSSPDFTQWQWYADGHPWEVHYQNNSRVGANIAEHAIVSLAEMVQQNPSIQTPGMIPHLGSKLSVKWKYFDPLVAGIVAADSLVVLATIWAARSTPYRKIA